MAARKTRKRKGYQWMYLSAAGREVNRNKGKYTARMNTGEYKDFATITAARAWASKHPKSTYCRIYKTMGKGSEIPVAIHRRVNSIWKKSVVAIQRHLQKYPASTLDPRKEVENLRNRLASEGLLRGSDEKVLSVEEAIEEIENLRDRLAAEGLLRGFW